MQLSCTHSDYCGQEQCEGVREGDTRDERIMSQNWTCRAIKAYLHSARSAAIRGQGSDTIGRSTCGQGHGGAVPRLLCMNSYFIRQVNDEQEFI